MTETRWKVHRLQIDDDVRQANVDLYLVLPTDDPEQVERVERVADRAGLVITRDEAWPYHSRVLRGMRPNHH